MNDASDTQQLPTKTDVIKKVLGYGAKIEFLIGMKDDGTEDIRTFHLTPSPMRDIPHLEELVNIFFDEAAASEIDVAKPTGATEWKKEMLDASAEIVHLALKKMHPDMTQEKCLEIFTLGVLSAAVELVMDVNDFFTGLEKMTKSRIPNLLQQTQNGI